MRHYCSLWDRNYMVQGVALHKSLLEHSSEDFRLYVLCMDEETEKLLTILSLPKLIRLRLRDFEAPMMHERIRAGRTWQEYCWTCGSNLTNFLMKSLEMPELTYLDADTCFFSDPLTVFKEIDDRSIAFIPHRFPPALRHKEALNGRFNVSWVTFRATNAGKTCLDVWASQCREWCYARSEDGKFGDQGYLDKWPEYYPDDSHIIANIGVGLAPWNISQYTITKESGRILVDGTPLVFYHYHELKESDDGKHLHLTRYCLRPNDIELVYMPYIERYKAARSLIASIRL